MLEVGPIPSMWNVILFRIRQAEQRARILTDWEVNVFGQRLREGVRHQRVWRSAEARRAEARCRSRAECGVAPPG